MTSYNQPHYTVSVRVMVMSVPKPSRSFKYFYNAFFSLCIVHKQSACKQACSKTDFHKVYFYPSLWHACPKFTQQFWVETV